MRCLKAFGERIAAVRHCRSDQWRSNGSPPTSRPYSTTGGHVASLPSSERTVAQPLSKLVVIGRTTSRRFQHPALDIIGLLRGLKASGEASRSLAGATQGQQEQKDREGGEALLRNSGVRHEFPLPR